VPTIVGNAARAVAAKVSFLDELDTFSTRTSLVGPVR
jgi:hypothetical protein